ncbi:MAG: flagellar protein FliS [Clostridia bacterium]|nr:flagellar protein FliS [Clostridia bacterium]
MEITTARVVNSTELELVLLSYEIIIDDINKNMKVDSRKVNLTNAKNFLMNLRSAIDMKYDMAKNLIALYDYVGTLLVSSEITSNDERREALLSEASNIMTKLYEA